jgi:putative salt-induced outer membrane protein YdiY
MKFSQRGTLGMNQFAAGAIALVLGASGFAAQPAAGEQVLVSVKTGEAFLGTLVSDDDTAVVIDHPTLGRLQMPRGQVLAVAPAPTGEVTVPAAAGAQAAAAAAAAAPDAPAAAKPIDPESFWEGWKGNVELGLNGANGNSENFAARAGFGLKRETEKMLTTLGFSYNYGTSDGDKNTDRGRLDARNDWKLAPTPWRLFVQGSVEYDQFQDWDWRTSLFGGVGYELVKTDRHTLVLKGGLGIVKEFGGSDNRLRPEGLAGFDYEFKIKDGHRLFVNFDSYWNLLEIPQYRLLTQAGYEILLDAGTGMALKLGLEDRYQSNPGADKKKNDLLYFATIVWNF